MIVLVELEDGFVQKIIGTYKDMVEAEKELQGILEEYRDNVIGYDDDYVQIEDDYGTIIGYQIISIPE